MVVAIDRSLLPLPRRRFIECMCAQYCRMVHRDQKLRNIGTVVCEDLRLTFDQCQEAITHLLLLRRASQACARFYSSLDPEPMKLVAPWGTLTKLAALDDEVTEIVLLLDALAPISGAPTYERVQLQLTIRKLYPWLMITYDEVVSQLSGLIQKVEEQSDTEGQS